MHTCISWTGWSSSSPRLCIFDARRAVAYSSSPYSFPHLIYTWCDADTYRVAPFTFIMLILFQLAFLTSSGTFADEDWWFGEYDGKTGTIECCYAVYIVFLIFGALQESSRPSTSKNSKNAPLRSPGRQRSKPSPPPL
jgi:hypothetical protein